MRISRLNNCLRAAHNVLPRGKTRLTSVASSSANHKFSHGGAITASRIKRSNTTSSPKRPRSPQFRLVQHAYMSTYVSKHFRLAPGEVESFLNRHRVKYRCSETHAIIEECPFCHPTRDDPSNLYRLYVARTTGVFHCHRCKKGGKWFDLKNRYATEMISSTASIGEEPKTQGHSSGSRQHHQKNPFPSLTSQKTYARNLWKEENSSVKAYLNKRGLKNEVLRKYGVGCGRFDVIMGRDVKRLEQCVTFPMYDDNGTLVRHKIRPVQTKSGMRLSPKGGSWGFFGLNTIPSDAKSVVLTEGEYDAMCVYQATGRPAISVPNGASSLPLELLPFLERFDLIYLWMDEDGPGQAGAETFSRKLGARRCLSVRGLHVKGKPCKDANDGLLREIDLEALIRRAEAVQHSGLVRFQDIRDQVLADLNNIHDPNVIRSQSIPRLHELMKGLRPGELTIFSGRTGAGKTTLLSQLSLDYCVQNVPTLWGSFEMDNTRLAGKLLSQFHAVYSKKRDNLTERYDYWADRFSELPFYFMRYHGSNPAEQVIEAMEFANYVYDCGHVVLDNLQFMSYVQKAGLHYSQLEVMDDALAQIRQFCTTKKVHVTLVIHPRKDDDNETVQLASVYGSAKATQEADNVLFLQRTNEGRILEVAKNRFDGTLGGIPLKFDKKRLFYSQRDSCGGWLGWDGGWRRQERTNHTDKTAVYSPESEMKVTDFGRNATATTGEKDGIEGISQQQSTKDVCIELPWKGLNEKNKNRQGVDEFGTGDIKSECNGVQNGSEIASTVESQRHLPHARPLQKQAQQKRTVAGGGGWEGMGGASGRR